MASPWSYLLFMTKSIIFSSNIRIIRRLGRDDQAKTKGRFGGANHMTCPAFTLSLSLSLLMMEYNGLGLLKAPVLCLTSCPCCSAKSHPPPRAYTCATHPGARTCQTRACPSLAVTCMKHRVPSLCRHVASPIYVPVISNKIKSIARCANT